MATRTRIRAAAHAGLIAVSWLVPWQASVAGDAPANSIQTMQIAASDASSHSVALGVSKSLVIDLPRDIKDVLVADPTIANVVVRSSRRAYIIGIKQGQTSIFIFDAQGKQIASLEIAVMRDLNGIRAALKHVLPDDDITRRGHRRCRRAVRHRGEPTGVAAGLRYGVTSGRSRDVLRNHRRRVVTTGRQRSRGSRPRPGHAQGDRRRGRARRHQAARRQPVRVAGLRHGRRQFQQHQSVLGLRPVAQRLRDRRQLQVGYRYVAGHGTGQRHPHAGRAEPDRDLRRDRDLHGRRRVSGLERLLLLPGVEYAGRGDNLPAGDHFQEIRRRSEFHSGRAQRGPHQPQGDDRGVGSVDPEFDNRRRSPAPPRRRLFRRSAPGAPIPRWRFRPAARWPWPA